MLYNIILFFYAGKIMNKTAAMDDPGKNPRDCIVLLTKPINHI
jgi:hypothetical protein